MTNPTARILQTSDPIRDYADAVRARMVAETEEPRTAGPQRDLERAARTRVILATPLGRRWEMSQVLASVRDLVGVAGYQGRYGTRDAVQAAQSDLAQVIRDAREHLA